MVRINLIEPVKLADQHLIAEYNEILMLIGYIIRYPKINNIPHEYTLGKGHMRFFKNKLKYLKKRHEELKTEMRKRGFKTNKTINLNLFDSENKSDWEPQKEDKDIIKRRLIEKIKSKPDYYKYYSQKRSVNFFINLLKD